MLVGEQWFDPPWPERPRTVDGLIGDHECGTVDDFTRGQPWPYTGPAIRYDEDHIPLCCPRIRPPQVTGGGVPSAYFNYTPAPFASTCCDAPVMVPGVAYTSSVTEPFPAGLQVWRVPIATGTQNLQVQYTGGFFVLSIQVTRGPTCANQNEVLFASSMGNYNVPVPGDGVRTICINIIPNFPPTPNSYTLTYTQGSTTHLTGGGIPSATFHYTPPGHHDDSTHGGGQLGGAAGDVPGGIDATAGGSRGGGAAGDVPSGIDATAGGQRAGGSVGEEPGGNDPTAGGQRAGGSAGDVPSATDPTAGGERAGGSAGDVPSGIDPTAGGERAGGSAGDNASGIDPTHGGSRVGGAAGDTLTPPVPTFDTLSSGSLATAWTAPSPARTGALLVAVVCTGAGTQTAGSGWHQEQQVASSDGSTVLGCYTRVCTGSDPAPITGAAGQYVCYQMKYWNAVNTSAPNHDAGADTHAIAPSVALTAPGFVIRGFGATNQPVGTVFTGAGTVTTVRTATPNVSVGRLSSSTNPTGTATGTLTTSQVWATITLTIR